MSEQAKTIRQTISALAYADLRPGDTDVKFHPEGGCVMTVSAIRHQDDLFLLKPFENVAGHWSVSREVDPDADPRPTGEGQLGLVRGLDYAGWGISAARGSVATKDATSLWADDIEEWVPCTLVPTRLLEAFDKAVAESKIPEDVDAAAADFLNRLEETRERFGF